MEDDESLVWLNVGGTYYCTSRDTLTKHDSFFHAMLSSKLHSRRDQKGRIFVDRDGTNFRHVLNFLRDGPAALEGLSETVLRELSREADFYQLAPLCTAIEQRLQRLRDSDNKTSKAETRIVYLGGYGNHAVVYSAETQGGFSTSCVALNELLSKGFSIQGVLGANGQYYCVCQRIDQESKGESEENNKN